MPDLVWRKERPTKGGVYWHRNRCRMTVGEMYRMRFYVCGQKRPATLTIEDEWAGPIPEPKDPKNA